MDHDSATAELYMGLDFDVSSRGGDEGCTALDVGGANCRIADRCVLCGRNCVIAEMLFNRRLRDLADEGNEHR